MDEQKMIRSVTLVGVLGNILLTAFKFFAGIVGRSGAMISDAVHSLSDVIATLIAFFGSILSRRPADKEHPYGHERVESIASLFLGLILFITGLEIWKSGMRVIFAGDYDSLKAPGMIALIAAILSIVTKESMYRYTRYVAEKLNSPVFMADAWHHRSDALSSIGSLIGIGGSMLGLPILDSVAGMVISLFILKVAYDIVKSAVQNMMDTSAGADYDEKIRDFVAEQSGVECVDLVHTRMFGSKVYVDLEIGVDETITVREGHDIAERVHDSVEEHFREVKHIMVHVNPSPH